MYAAFYKMSRLMACLGGLMLLALIALTCLSIVGRSLNELLHAQALTNTAPALAQWLLNLGVGPVTGDFELVEAGVAFAIFSFLPLCQITAGHASVDIFTSRLSPRHDRLLQMLIDLLFAIVLVVIAVQLFAGMESKRSSGQTSFLLQFPVWWGYALCMAGAGMAAIVSVYIAFARVMTVFTGRDYLPQMDEAKP